MITGRDFIVLSDDWNGLPTSSIHLFRRLKSKNRIFWFNTIGRMPKGTLADAGKVLRAVANFARPRKQRATASATEHASNLRVVSPLMMPWFKPVVRHFNCASLLRKYEGLRRRHDVRQPIVVTTFPHAADFVQAVPAALKVYYCVDEFLYYPGVNHADWAVMEDKLLREVDALVVTSKKLAEKRITECPVLHLPHGVDFDHFHNAVLRSEPEPRMECIRKPIVGFFGLLSKWVDLENIAALASAFPHCSFVVIGRSETDLRSLGGRPNLHYLGWVPYGDLPRYARYFDVGLISFRKNRMTEAINPLKLMEYFALGLPVLATRIPELEQVSGPLRLADSAAEFHAGLEEILGGSRGFLHEEALAVARQSTWDARVEQLSGFLEALCGLAA